MSPWPTHPRMRYPGQDRPASRSGLTLHDPFRVGSRPGRDTGRQLSEGSRVSRRSYREDREVLINNSWMIHDRNGTRGLSERKKDGGRRTGARGPQGGGEGKFRDGLRSRRHFERRVEIRETKGGRRLGHLCLVRPQRTPLNTDEDGRDVGPRPWTGETLWRRTYHNPPTCHLSFHGYRIRVRDTDTLEYAVLLTSIR